MEEKSLDKVGQSLTILIDDNYTTNTVIAMVVSNPTSDGIVYVLCSDDVVESITLCSMCTQYLTMDLINVGALAPIKRVTLNEVISQPGVPGFSNKDSKLVVPNNGSSYDFLSWSPSNSDSKFGNNREPFDSPQWTTLLNNLLVDVPEIVTTNVTMDNLKHCFKKLTEINNTLDPLSSSLTVLLSDLVQLLQLNTYGVNSTDINLSTRDGLELNVSLDNITLTVNGVGQYKLKFTAGKEIITITPIAYGNDTMVFMRDNTTMMGRNFTIPYHYIGIA